MNVQTWISALLGLLTVGIPAISFYFGTKANRTQARAEQIKAEVESKGVDALAYERAAKLYDDMIGALQRQVDRLETRNRELENEVASLRRELTELRQEGEVK